VDEAHKKVLDENDKDDQRENSEDCGGEIEQMLEAFLVVGQIEAEVDHGQKEHHVDEVNGLNEERYFVRAFQAEKDRVDY
jgi:hypothetical protein